MASPRADEFRARYTVSLIGFPIGGGGGRRGSIGPASYRIDLNAKLTGVAAMVANVKLAPRPRPALCVEAAFAPSTYATTSANSQGSRTVRMSLDAGNRQGRGDLPAFRGQGRKSAGHRGEQAQHSRSGDRPDHDGFPRAKPLVGPAACNRTIPVYDGYVRFDVTLHFVDVRQVAVDGYSGPVFGLRRALYARLRSQAGTPNRRNLWLKNRDIEAWARADRAGACRRALPISQMMTLAGTAVIDAVEFSVEAFGPDGGSQRIDGAAARAIT